MIQMPEKVVLWENNITFQIHIGLDTTLASIFDAEILCFVEVIKIVIGAVRHAFGGIFNLVL